MKFIFTKYAKKQWGKLSPQDRERVGEKLVFLGASENFSAHLKKVHHLEPATHRLRVGNYRLLLECDFSLDESLVLKIGHRREVYR